MGREDHKREILNEIVTHSSNQTTPDLKHVITNYEQVLSNKIKKYFPGRLERGPLDKRCDKIKEWMRQNLIDNPLDEEKKEKYGVLSHKYTIANLTATGVDNTALGITGHKML